MSLPLDTDVIVVGGGLAGAATALRLSRGGVKVTLVEPRTFPRDKPCGEGLLPHGTRALADLGFPNLLREADAQPFRGILYRAHGARAEGDFAEGALGYGVRRRHLDGHLHGAMERAPGVECVRDKVEEVRADAEGAVVRTAGGRQLRARFVVGADGPRSRTRHELGLDRGPPKAGRYALRQHFALAAGMPMPDRVEVTACQGFEIYMTPVEPGVVGVAALCERQTMRALEGKPAERLAALLERAPAESRQRLAEAQALGPAMACGPLRVRSAGVHRPGALLVGDAAGYVDAITGEGMSLALATSNLASDALLSVLQGHQPQHRAFARYAAQRAAIFRDHALLTHGLVFLARHPVLARRAIARLGKEPALFTRLLAVNDGQRSFLSLGAFDLCKLAIGSAVS